MIPTSMITRIPAAHIGRVAKTMNARALSTHGVEAVEKLRGALEEYRTQHYSQCMPSRFKKDLLRAAMTGESDRVALDGMQRVLANINMQHRVTRSEMETIFREVGGNTDAIPVDRFMKII